MDFDLKKKIVPFIVFFIVANPEMFKLTRSIAGGWVASSYGVPTNAGLALHALVFVLIAHFVWRIVWGKKSTYAKIKYSDGDAYVVNTSRGVQGGHMNPGDFDAMGCQ
jgi:hypothetical protein